MRRWKAKPTRQKTSRLINRRPQPSPVRYRVSFTEFFFWFRLRERVELRDVFRSVIGRERDETNEKYDKRAIKNRVNSVVRVLR